MSKHKVHNFDNNSKQQVPYCKINLSKKCCEDCTQSDKSVLTLTAVTTVVKP